MTCTPETPCDTCKQRETCEHDYSIDFASSPPSMTCQLCWETEELDAAELVRRATAYDIADELCKRPARKERDHA
jgi:hypothetical protein